MNIHINIHMAQHRKILPANTDETLTTSAFLPKVIPTSDFQVLETP